MPIMAAIALALVGMVGLFSGAVAASCSCSAVIVASFAVAARLRGREGDTAKAVGLATAAAVLAVFAWRAFRIARKAAPLWGPEGGWLPPAAPPPADKNLAP